MPARGGKNKSLIAAVATDAPLIPIQLQRVCKRVALGMARTGAISTQGSGDLFLAFSTASPEPPDTRSRCWLRPLDFRRVPRRN